MLKSQALAQKTKKHKIKDAKCKFPETDKEKPLQSRNQTIQYSFQFRGLNKSHKSESHSLEKLFKSKNGSANG